MLKTIIRMILLAAAAIAGFALAPSSRAQVTPQAQVVWGASVVNSVATAQGVDLPVGDLALLGTFDLTPSQIQADASSISLLEANFVSYASAGIGDGNPAGTPQPAPGFWLTDTIASTDKVIVGNETFSIAHDQIYYWVFNAPTIMAATEQGIFTAPDNPNWIFPDDNDVPNSTVTDISDVPPNFQGILVGSFGVSDSPLTDKPQYNLAPIIVIPEPASYQLLLAAAAVGLSFQLSSRMRSQPRSRIDPKPGSNNRL
jgi:hypothetical protein